jgi:hypothetical protein
LYTTLIIEANLEHIISIVTTSATSDKRVTITRIESNSSINNCTIIYRGIKRATTDFIYNKELNNASI